MANTTIAYLERRYIVLEKEIADALHQSPTDDLAIADLEHRKAVIADEIQHNRAWSNVLANSPPGPAEPTDLASGELIPFQSPSRDLGRDYRYGQSRRS